jgi:putative transposase
MTNPFRYFNSSPEVIRLVVMMYVRYPLSLRNVEDLLAERGIDISHETVRFWWNRFGPMFAAEIRVRRVAHMRGYPQWRWHLDEVFVKVNGKLRYLWRAVDHEGEVLEAVVTARRDKGAALKLLKRIMKKYGQPRSVVTDGLCSYSAAMKEIGNADRQEAGRRPNNRAENSHQPFRRREQAIYLESRGTPSVPEDLLSHECLLYRSAEHHWKLVGSAGKAVELKVASRLRCNNGEVAHDWALAGSGLIMKSWVDVAGDVRAGRLVRVLPGWRSEPTPVCALFPSNPRLPLRVRLFLDAMVKRLAAIEALAPRPGIS